MRAIFSVPALALCIAQLCMAQVDPRWKPNDPERPLPPVIEPGTASTQDAPGHAPSDAVVLFDGKDLSQWAGEDGQPAKWKVADGYMEVVPHSGYIANCMWSSRSLRLRLARIRDVAIVACF